MARKLGSAARDVLIGSGAADVLFGRGGNDTLKGLSGNDRLDGGAGRDRMQGGRGKDVYIVDHVRDQVVELLNQGSDTVRASVGFALPSNVENLVLTGGAALKGTGNALANMITGNSGNNVLDGAGGADSLHGGRGNDRFLFDAKDKAVQGGAGVDSLLLAGSQALDLRSVKTVFSSLEVLDLRAGGRQSAVLDSARVLAFTNGQALRVEGSAADLVTLAGGDWQRRQVQQLNGQDYTRFTKDGAVVLLDSDIAIAAEVIDVTALGGAQGLSLHGAAAGDAAGFSVAGGNDWNGDGFDDLVIGAPGAAINGAASGSVYVVFGGAALGGVDLGALGAAASGFVLHGGRAGDHLGYSVGLAGDTNADGYAEALAGTAGPVTPQLTVPANLYVARGQALAPPEAITVSPPPSGVVVRSLAPSSFNASSSEFAVAVAAAGDVNGDGREDLLAGFEFLRAQGAPTTAGVWSLFLGANLAETIHLPADAAHAGAAVAAAGDINGDGYGDVLIGAPHADLAGQVDAGRVDVLLGGAAGLSAPPGATANAGAFRLNGVAAAALTGSAVASAGDFNADGFADLVIGAPGGNVAYIVFGQAAAFALDVDLGALDGGDGLRITGVGAGDLLGSAVARAGDVNGDGYDDVLLGAPGAHGGAGAAYLLFGASGGFRAELALSGLRAEQGVVFDGTAAGAQLGAAVAGARDVNGDGLDDVLLGAPAGAGTSYLVFGRAFTGAAATVGSEGDDRLSGGSGRDTLIGGLGHDRLDGGAGADSLRGGAGNDAFVFDPLDRIDGGSGLDTLLIAATGQGIDFRALDDTRIQGIEVVDLGGHGDNLLQFALSDLLALSDDAQSLRVLGDAGDAVATSGTSWALLGNISVDGVDYTEYAFGGARLLLDIDLTVTIDVIG